MLLPSKELLSEVWGSEVTSIENLCNMWDMEVLPFWVKQPNRVSGFSDKKYHIAIETIAYKCKEWASKHGVNIWSWLNNAEIRDGHNCYEKSFTGDTEPEAIFKACEWIMEQTK